jgi:hypothetical protein
MSLASLKDGLVSWWALEEASGNRVDAHGPNDLAQVNSVTNTPGKIGNAAVFPGTNANNLAATLSVDVPGTACVAGWVNVTSFNNGRLFHKRSGRGWELMAATTGTAIQITGSDPAFAPAKTGLSTGVWYFFYAYVDEEGEEVGVSVDNGTAVTESTAALDVIAPADIKLGERLAGDRPLDGLLDEVGLWNRILTPDEITALYNAGAGITYSDIPSAGGTFTGNRPDDKNTALGGPGNTDDLETAWLKQASGGPVEAAFSAAGSAYMLSDGNIADHILQDIVTGIGPTTYTTPDGLALPDHEGIYREYKAGERRVENAIPDSTNGADWTHAGITLTPATDPDGGNTAFTTTSDIGNRFLTMAVESGDIGNLGLIVRVSMWMRRRTGTGAVTIYNGTNGGQGTAITAQLDGTWRRFSTPALPTTSTNGRVGFLISVGTDQIDFWNPQYEIVGAVNDNPSEYVPTSSAAVTRHYSNVNGNTVLNNVVTEAVGAPLAVAPSLYAAPALTNALAGSRDLSSGDWVTASLTATYDQIGIGSEPNTATLLDDQDVSNIRFASNNVSKPGRVEGTPEVFRIWLKKQVGQREVSLQWWNGTNSVQRFAFYYLNQDTGVLEQRASLTSGVSVSAEAELQTIGGVEWWVVSIEATGQAGWANDITNMVVSPAARATGDPVDSPTTGAGTCIVGNLELHYDKTIDQVKGSAPIFTSGVAVTNAACYCEWDNANQNLTRAAWYYEWRNFTTDGSVLGPNSIWAGIQATVYGRGFKPTRTGMDTSAQSETLTRIILCVGTME